MPKDKKVVAPSGATHCCLAGFYRQGLNPDANCELWSSMYKKWIKSSIIFNRDLDRKFYKKVLND